MDSFIQRITRHAPIDPTVDPLVVHQTASTYYLSGLFLESTLFHEDGRWHVRVSALTWGPDEDAAWDGIARTAGGSIEPTARDNPGD